MTAFDYDSSEHLIEDRCQYSLSLHSDHVVLLWMQLFIYNHLKSLIIEINELTELLNTLSCNLFCMKHCSLLVSSNLQDQQLEKNEQLQIKESHHHHAWDYDRSFSFCDWWEQLNVHWFTLYTLECIEDVQTHDSEHYHLSLLWYLSFDLIYDDFLRIVVSLIFEILNVNFIFKFNSCASVIFIWILSWTTLNWAFVHSNSC